MDDAPTKTFTFPELAAAADLPPRTVRYYISRGLVPGPSRSGPGATYGEEHLAALQRVQELAERGQTLSAIHATIHPADPFQGVVSYHHIPLRDGFILLAPTDKTNEQIKALLMGLLESPCPK